MYLAKPQSTQSRIFHRRSVRRLLASWRFGEMTPNATGAVERDLYLKRVVDVFGAALGLALFSPVLLLSGLLIRLTLGPPVLYVSRRCGLHGCVFRLYKFRSMTEARDDRGKLLSDEKRLTPLGRLLRRTSLDELPQLANVLNGDMSLVGPRPLPAAYFNRLSRRHATRHRVRPGMSGWAQVNYRDKDRSWEEKLTQDVWYVENTSLWLDIRIILMTLAALARRFVTNGEGLSTSREFMGSPIEKTLEATADLAESE